MCDSESVKPRHLGSSEHSCAAASTIMNSSWNGALAEPGAPSMMKLATGVKAQ